MARSESGSWLRDFTIKASSCTSVHNLPVAGSILNIKGSLVDLSNLSDTLFLIRDVVVNVSHYIVRHNLGTLVNQFIFTLPLLETSIEHSHVLGSKVSKHPGGARS